MRREKEDIAKELEKAFERWYHIYSHGCTDPFYTDGVNIDLCRNHILYYKGKCEETYKDNYFAYPEFYWVPTPPKLQFNFMAVDRVIGGAMCVRTKPESN